MITIDVHPDDIMARHGLGPDRRVQRFLQSRVRARADKFVPFRSGLLKNTVHLAEDGSAITYLQKYAQRQYYNENYHHSPGRQARWVEVMLLFERSDLVQDVQAYINSGGGSV